MGIKVLLYLRIPLHHEFVETLPTLQHSNGTKRSLINENSLNFWHKRLGHISKERLERLVKDGILSNLDFIGLDVCIKGKQTKHTKKSATRSTKLLEIIHANIYGPFDAPSFSKEKYFITFIDDFSRYTFIYCMKNLKQWKPLRCTLLR